MVEVNKRNPGRKMVEVTGFKGTKTERKAVVAVDTKTTEKDGQPQSGDKVFVADCSFADVEVKTTSLALSMTNCKNVVVTVARVMTVLEMVACENVIIKFSALTKNVDISSSKDILLDFGAVQEDGIPVADVNIVTENWSQVKVGFKVGDKMIEKSLPTKIDHKLNITEGSEEPEIVTTPSALA